MRQSQLGLIEEDKPMTECSIYPSLTNVNPYVWGNYSLLGDRNDSIAIFDTGIDSTHPMLSNYSSVPDFSNDSIKVIGWFDGTPDGNTTPVDYEGHGTAVSAIAAGNPFNGTNTNGTISTTFTANYNSTQSLTYIAGYGEYLNVSRPGVISLNYYWRRTGGSNNTRGYGIYLYQPSCNDPNKCQVFFENITNVFLTGNSGKISIFYNITDNFGLYGVYLAFSYQDPNSLLDIVSYGNYPFLSDPLITHSEFSGISPNTKLVGVKVFDNKGFGYASYLINGINWTISNKKVYHITIASMSLAFPCSSSGCTVSDKIISVEIAVNSLVNAGIVTVVAAGNSGYMINNQINTPGDIGSVITVGETDDYHTITDYSSYGFNVNSTLIKPDIVAPGGSESQGGIITADSNYNDAQGTIDGVIPDFQKNDLTPVQGTSMATPYTAGIAALIIQAMGGYSNWIYSNQSVFKVKQLMLIGARSSSRANKDIQI